MYSNRASVIRVSGRRVVGSGMERLEQRVLMDSPTSSTAVSLDSSFGTNGTVVVIEEQSALAGANLALLPDGAIVAVGSASGGLAVARYNANGVPDITFGPDRTGRAMLDASERNDTARAVAVAPDGSIVVAGTTSSFSVNNSNGDIIVARLTPAGVADATFGGGDGVITIDIAGRDDIAVDVAVQPDGKIVVAGYDTNGFQGPERSAARVVLLRLNPDGSPDPGFGSAGVAITDLSTVWEEAHTILLPGDGKVLVAASGSTPSRTSESFILRYDSAGTLDGRFGKAGVAPIPDFAHVRDLVVTPAGIIVAAGSGRRNHAGASLDFRLLALDPNGGIHRAFGTDGVVLTNFGKDRRPGLSTVDSDEIGWSVQLGDDGSLLVAGTTTAPDMLPGPPPVGVVALGIARYTSAGVLDASFGSSGTVVASFGAGQVSEADVVLDAEGRPVVLVEEVSAVRRTVLSRFQYESVPGTSPPAATPVKGRTLNIRGTRGGDEITVSMAPESAGAFDVVFNGVRQRFAGNRLRRVVLTGGRGDDVITVDSSITLPTIINGGPGNDRLTGGSGADRIIGGKGNDTLFSRDSVVDRVLGGPGIDQAQTDKADRSRSLNVLLP